MHPIICKIGPLTVYSYGVMMAIAVMVCSFFLSKDAARTLHLQPEVIFDFAFWVMCAGILGARIFYVLLNLDYFLNDPWEIVKIQNGGLAWQGGLVGGTIAGIFFIRKNALPFWDTLDVAAPYIALGHAIGRIGCFLNGCCFGKEVSWGIYFPAYHARLHPTQLYESASLLLIFFILKNYQKVSNTPTNSFLSVDSSKFKEINRQKQNCRGTKPPGKVFVLYLILASLERFVVEFFRADHTTTFLGLSIFQGLSLVVVAVALYANSRIKSR